MGRIRITMDVYDEASDPDDSTGITNEAFTEINDVLMSYGDDITVERDDAD